MAFDEITFEQKENTLFVSGNLNAEYEDDFTDALNVLGAFKSKLIILNIVNIRYINSGFIRLIAMLALSSQKDGKELVIHANERIKRLITLGGIDHICKIEIVH